MFSRIVLQEIRCTNAWDCSHSVSALPGGQAHKRRRTSEPIEIEDRLESLICRVGEKVRSCHPSGFELYFCCCMSSNNKCFFSEYVFAGEQLGGFGRCPGGWPAKLQKQNLAHIMFCVSRLTLFIFTTARFPFCHTWSVLLIFCLLDSSARLLPEKLTVYTTLVGLLNARNYNFGGEFVEAMIRQLKETLKNNLYDEAVYLVCWF